jgi:ketosteroid isomerase-like protein
MNFRDIILVIIIGLLLHLLQIKTYKMKKVLFTVLVATSLFACKSSTETKPAFNLEDAKKEIAEMNKRFEDAVLNSDSVAMVNLYTDDAKWMNPNAPSVIGKQALTSELSKLLNAGIGSAKLNTTDVWGDENFVTEEGNYVLNAKDGSQMDIGKYIVLWKRVDGKLMFFRDMFSSDLPAAPVK